MTPSAYTPWPEGRPPHMVALGANQPSESLNRIIENHIEKCEECQDWALQNGRSYEKWIYPGND